MRILYLGLPLGAACLSRRGHRPIVAALAPLDLPGRRRVRRTIARAGTLVLGRPDLTDPQVLRTLRTAKPDAVLSWFWPARIPEAVLALAPRGAFGTHPSLLPRWRGPDPYFWAIASGDTETGVTLHRLGPDYDTGAIVAQRRVPIDAHDDAWSLARKLDRPALELLVECADRLAAGETLEGAPQDERAASWAGAPTARDLAVDWHRSVDEVLRLVRAAAPSPGATALLGETHVAVLRARRFSGELPRALLVAEALRTDAGPAVRVANGAVQIDRVRTEDGALLEGAAVGALLS